MRTIYLVDVDGSEYHINLDHIVMARVRQAGELDIFTTVPTLILHVRATLADFERWVAGAEDEG